MAAVCHERNLLYFNNCATLTKHNHDDTADDRSWNRNKDGAKLADDAHDHEDDARTYRHTRAANLLLASFPSVWGFDGFGAPHVVITTSRNVYDEIG